MAFDIFLQCYRNGEPATFKRSVVDEIFAPYAFGDPELTMVTFPDGSGSCLYLDQGDDIQGMMFNHCGGDEFFEALYQLAARTKSVILWPEAGPASSVITDPETWKHLPEFWHDGSGPPRVVKSGLEVQDCIFGKKPRLVPEEKP